MYHLIQGAFLSYVAVSGVILNNSGDSIVLAQDVIRRHNYAIWVDGVIMTKDAALSCPDGSKFKVETIETVPDKYQVSIRCVEP